MRKFLIWIRLFCVLTLCVAKLIDGKLSDGQLQEMRKKWTECCKHNKCLHNSCYMVEWSATSWAAIRQRCQSKYPDWPSATDIFRLRNESELYLFWDMLQNPYLPNRSVPKTIWTSGTRCPISNSGDTVLVSKWVSTNQLFPSWLNDKTNESVMKYDGGCKFLAMSPAPFNTDVKYDFQDQTASHPGICEFSFPEDIEYTTETEGTTETKGKTETEGKIVTEFSTVSLPSTVTHITESQLPTEPSTSSTTKETTTEFSSTTTLESTTIHKSTLSSRPVDGKVESIGTEIVDTSYATEERPETLPTVTTTLTTIYVFVCKGRNVSGILWPDTLAGETVHMKCPEGMAGQASWSCNATTLKFSPEKPNVENCRHIWIADLEMKIKKGDDAVEISTKLAQETKKNEMSHGDISALVNVSSKLIRLYTEQKGEEEFEMTESEIIPMSYNFTKTMVASISNMLRSEIKGAWEGLPEDHQTREAATILKLVTTIGGRLSCIKKSHGKLQFTVSEENIALQTFNLNNTYENEDRIVFPQETRTIKPSSSIILPANLRFKAWFSPCKTYSTAVGVIYKQVGEFLKDQHLVDSKTEVATKVISFSLSNSTESILLSEGKVMVTLQHKTKLSVKEQKLRNPRCVFWNFSKSEYGQWDSNGCHFLSFNETHTRCQCDHLTNFAVLMDINDNIKEDKILSMMTYVCCGVSSITLIITLVCFFTIRALHCRRSIITGNLCFSLLITNMLILFGLDDTQNTILCAIIAGVLHYWILAAFCWMLVEGYHLYKMVILVFQRGTNLSVKFYYAFAYGTPLVIVSISAGIRSNGYGGSNYCWLSSTDGLMWSFVGPACAIILVNVVIFILTLRSASSVKIKREQPTLRKIKSWVRGSMSVMCLLGLTWCLGLLYLDKKLHFFSYIFTVLNGLQGVFIFLFHVVLNDKVSTTCFFFGKPKNERTRRCLNYTSSHQLNSKTSTRTSTACLSTTNLQSARKNSTQEPHGRRCSLSQVKDIARQNQLNNRKLKAQHTLSENLQDRFFSPAQKTRSQSFPTPDEHFERAHGRF